MEATSASTYTCNCGFCGQPMTVETGKRGRPRQYHEHCSELANLMVKLQHALNDWGQVADYEAKRRIRRDLRSIENTALNGPRKKAN